MKPSERIMQRAHSRADAQCAATGQVAADLQPHILVELLRHIDELEASPGPSPYRDTEHRMQHDAEFRAAVMMLAASAQRYGWTPGELKQIAFRAAYEVEARRPPEPIKLHVDGKVPW
jgi:hypothetical protein